MSPDAARLLSALLRLGIDRVPLHADGSVANPALEARLVRATGIAPESLRSSALDVAVNALADLESRAPCRRLLTVHPRSTT